MQDKVFGYINNSMTHLEVTRLSSGIASEPENGLLYAQRALAYRKLRKFAEAERDCYMAARFNHSGNPDICEILSDICCPSKFTCTPSQTLADLLSNGNTLLLLRNMSRKEHMFEVFDYRFLLKLAKHEKHGKSLEFLPLIRDIRSIRIDPSTFTELASKNSALADIVMATSEILLDKRTPPPNPAVRTPTTEIPDPLAKGKKAVEDKNYMEALTCYTNAAVQQPTDTSIKMQRYGVFKSMNCEFLGIGDLQRVSSVMDAKERAHALSEEGMYWLSKNSFTRAYDCFIKANDDIGVCRIIETLLSYRLRMEGRTIDTRLFIVPESLNEKVIGTFASDPGLMFHQLKQFIHERTFREAVDGLLLTGILVKNAGVEAFPMAE